MSKLLTHEDNEASNAQRCVTARVSAENIEWHGALTGCKPHACQRAFAVAGGCPNQLLYREGCQWIRL